MDKAFSGDYEQAVSDFSNSGGIKTVTQKIVKK